MTCPRIAFANPILALLIVTFLVGLTGCKEPASSEKEIGRESSSTNTGFGSDFIEGDTPAVEKKPDDITEQAREFFSKWLKSHGETNIINDETGVGVAQSDARLWAFLYGIKEAGDNSVSVEIEFRIVLPGGREIQEFLAGMGDTKEEAIQQVFANFTLSTFHTVYACFMNENDPHVPVEEVVIGGMSFTYTSDGVFTLGSDNIPKFDDVREQIKSLVTQSNFPHQIHWIKFVYGEHQGKRILLSATMNNEENQKLQSRAETLKWPKTTGFYMAKQFIVLRPAKN